MCRCCQSCWEDFYWNCIEERFCYDESIANYNPDDDEEYIASQKNGSVLPQIQPSASAADNNNLRVPPICDQPMRRGNSGLMSNAKIHEEDYRRETQTNVPMLGPEILSVFANSQIFQDHQPTKLNRISTKTHLAGVHSPLKEHSTASNLSAAAAAITLSRAENEQDRLLKRLEANLGGDIIDSIKLSAAASAASIKASASGSSVRGVSGTGSIGTGTSTPITPSDPLDGAADKRITFTLFPDSSPEGSQTLTPKKFDVIAEEDAEAALGRSTAASGVAAVNSLVGRYQIDEVILRPRLIDRHPHLLPPGGGAGGAGGVGPKKTLRSTKSVPHFNVRSAASETDIFSITGSGKQISMTPEVPSISYSNLPKNYEDTPTIEKYRVSQSLYSIQTANAARASKDDYSMPRYFRRSAMVMVQSSEALAGGSSSASMSSSREDVTRRPEKEKSKRLARMRGNLPPLLIHSVSFHKNRDESKQLD